MKRTLFACLVLTAGAVTLAAQEGGQTNPYAGTSNPPQDDILVTTDPPPIAKPAAGHPLVAPQHSSRSRQSATYSPAPPAQQPNDDGIVQMAPSDPYYQDDPASSYWSTLSDPNDQQQAPTKMYRPPHLAHATPGQQDNGSYSPAQQAPYDQSQQGAYDPSNSSDSDDAPSQPTLSQRISPSYDPDGDIVHPSALGPHQLAEGTTIHVRLVGRISSSDAVNGQRFRTRVAYDVLQNGRVLIPANSEIDGRIYEISRGHMGGGGSMHLRPETVILSDGTRFKLSAQVTDAPGANAHIGTEGTVKAGSRMKRDTVEYGGAIGAGASTGAYLGGPAGALAGAAIGAGVITAHLLISHPQATLESGTALQFTLTQRLNLVPSPSGD